MAVNREANQRLKPKVAICLRAPPPTRAGNLPQNMWVYAAQKLIGSGGKCVKGLFVTVESFDQEKVTLTNGQVLSHQEAVRSLRLAHSICFAACQGLTLQGVVRLECESPHFTLRHLYVASSRATSASLLEVV